MLAVQNHRCGLGELEEVGLQCDASWNSNRLVDQYSTIPPISMLGSSFQSLGSLEVISSRWDLSFLPLDSHV